MNYPQLYPHGAQANAGHDGSGEFWRAIPEGFDELELHHLRHGTAREVGADGFPFGVYEEGRVRSMRRDLGAPLHGSDVQPTAASGRSVIIVGVFCWRREAPEGTPRLLRLACGRLAQGN